MKKHDDEKEKDYIQEDDQDTIIIPIWGIFHQLKKYFILWLIIAVVAAACVFGVVLASSSSHYTPLTAMVSFTFDGIEDGLDPNGNEFDANDMKSPSVIRAAIDDMSLDEELVETVRSNLTINGVVPEDAVDQLTAYKTIFENNNTIDSVEHIMDVTYYPTEFTLSFDFSETGLDRTTSAELLNKILEEYKLYFLSEFGYNETYGTVLETIDYTSYDYITALDIYKDTINSLEDYLNSLKSIDTTGFRSSESGYTFDDLYDSVCSIDSVDYSMTSSYVLSNNITKDRDVLMSYYQYRIDTLKRNKVSYEEQMANVQDSIDNYQKEDIIIMGGSDSTSSTVLNNESAAYDDLISKKTELQKNISNTQSSITDYTNRLNQLKKKGTLTDAEMEEADAKMDTLTTRINTIIDATNTTASDFFENCAYSSAFSVLVPASGSFTSTLTVAKTNMIQPLLIVEALLFVIYICFSVVRAFIVAYNQKNAAIEESESEVEVVETTVTKVTKNK